MSNNKSLNLVRSSSQFAYITDANQTNLDLSGDFTFEVWVNLTSLPSSIPAVFPIINRYLDDASISSAYGFRFLNNDKLNVFWFSDTNQTNQTSIVSNSAVVVSGEVGSWLYFAFSGTPSTHTGTMYKGSLSSVPSSVVKTDSPVNATSIANSVSEFMVGANNVHTSPYTYSNFKIDELRIWNTARSEADLSDNYLKELVGNESGLVGYWQFEDDLLDKTSNNNDLIPSGSPTYSTSIPFDYNTFSIGCGYELSVSLSNLQVDYINVSFAVGSSVNLEMVYVVYTTEELSTDLTYEVSLSNEINLFTQYKVITSFFSLQVDLINNVFYTKPLVSLGTNYDLLNLTHIQTNLGYAVLTEPEITKNSNYELDQSSLNLQVDYVSVIYSKSGINICDLNYLINIPNISISKTLSYGVFGTFSQTKTSIYGIDNSLNFELNLGYSLLLQPQISKTSRYHLTTESGSLSVIEVDNRRIFQRNENNEFDIPIVGVYVGNPTTIEAKIVNFDTGSTIVDWMVIDSTPSGGSFNSVLTVPQGGWYRTQVRFSNATNIFYETDNKYAIGILVGCIGQSNMNLYFTHTPVNIYIGNNNLTSQRDASGWANVYSDPAKELANKINDLTGVPVALFNYSVGHTSLLASADSGNGYWLDESENSLYDKFITAVNSSEGYLEYIMWYQGEDEALVGSSKISYKNGLTTLLSNLRRDIGCHQGTLTMLMCSIGTYAGVDQWWDDIRNATKEISETDSKSYHIQIVDLWRFSTIHYGPEELPQHAIRVAQVIAYDKGIVSFYRGPHIESFVLIDSQTIDVNVVHEGGTNFYANPNITGFSVLDSGSLETIVSTTIINPNTIRLVISGSITGTPTVRYLYGANPSIGIDHTNDPVTTNAVYDNTVFTVFTNGFGNNINVHLPLEFNSNIQQSSSGVSTLLKNLSYYIFSTFISSKVASYTVFSSVKLIKSLSYVLSALDISLFLPTRYSIKPLINTIKPSNNNITLTPKLGTSLSTTGRSISLSLTPNSANKITLTQKQVASLTGSVATHNSGV